MWTSYVLASICLPDQVQVTCLSDCPSAGAAAVMMHRVSAKKSRSGLRTIRGTLLFQFGFRICVDDYTGRSNRAAVPGRRGASLQKRNDQSGAITIIPRAQLTNIH